MACVLVFVSLATSMLQQAPKRPRACAICWEKAPNQDWAVSRTTSSKCTSEGRGGGEIAVWGSRIQLRKIAEKLRKIAEKLRKNCDVVSGPPEPSRCNNSKQVAQNSQNFTETNSLWAVQLQEAPLNITVELQHEPKAADVVIQFVLRLVASGKGSRAGGRGLRGTCACD